MRILGLILILLAAPVLGSTCDSATGAVFALVQVDSATSPYPFSSTDTAALVVIGKPASPASLGPTNLDQTSACSIWNDSSNLTQTSTFFHQSSVVTDSSGNTDSKFPAPYFQSTSFKPGTKFSTVINEGTSTPEVCAVNGVTSYFYMLCLLP